jgi:apolipoprotein N-acyltransferase
MTARVLAIASGLMLSASLPSLDLTPLAWVGLVPLVWAIQGRTPGAAFRLGWLSGTTFFVATTYWIIHTISHYTTMPTIVSAVLLLLMSLVLGAYTGALAASLRWMERRRLPWVWLAPFVWVTLEWARGWFFIGFPWGALGYSQHRFVDLAQMVEVTSVYGVSALLVLVNVVIVQVLMTPGIEMRRRLPAMVVVTALLIVLPLAGRTRRAQILALPSAGTATVGIAQGNVDQERKWDPAFQAETLARYDRLTRAAADAGADIVVWPETATPFFFQEEGEQRGAVLSLARETESHIFFGSPAYYARADRTMAQANRAYMVDDQGWERDFYDKMQLVPFGEYVPFKQILFFVDQIVTTMAIGGIEPGKRATVFDGPDGRFGALICYEGIFPPLSRRLVASGADYLVNVTNDAWYGDTSAPWQHLVQATFRAIENRRPIVRAANTGVSAVVATDGSLLWQGPLDQEIWHVMDVGWPDVTTFYTRFGDVFVWLCVFVTLGALGAGLLQGRR